MAHIEQRSKNSWRITVSAGYKHGKKLFKKKTIKLPETLTKLQREKELNRQAVLFEEEVERGTYLDGNRITFEEFANKWLDEYAEKQLSPGTLKPYRFRLKERIIPALGHLKLSKIQPQHLMEFYNMLGEVGIRGDGRYKATPLLVTFLSDQTNKDIVDKSGISVKTVLKIKNEETVNKTTATKLCGSYDLNLDKYFSHINEKSLSKKTIKHHHSIVSDILSTAVKWNLISFNPASRVDTIKVEKYKPKSYDEVQLGQMFILLENEPMHYKTAIYLSVDTGIRASELAGLTWDKIDFDNRKLVINIQRQYVSGYGVFEKSPKTENGNRPVTISKSVIEKLKAYKDYCDNNKIEFGTAYTDSPYVFVHSDGKPLHPHRPYKWFTEFLIRHNLPRITLHQLRHTNASLLIAADMDIVTVSKRLGHSDPSVTQKIYAHMIDSKELEAANRMDMFYENLEAMSK